MASTWDIEIRPESTLSPRERAEARDSRVREFESQWSAWAEIARCCIEVRRDRDYELLGFTSWHAWLMDAAPRSRSYIYLAIGRYEELLPDIPEEELQQIPLGSAGVLRQLSSKIRQNPKIREAAKQKPSAVRKILAEDFPEQHIEHIVEVKLKFTASQWQVIQAEYDAYRMAEPNASLESFFEFAVSECL